MSSLLSQFNHELGSIVSRATQSLVQVRNASGRGGSGAGTIWHERGLIVTNAHVVRHQTPEVVLPDGRVFPATVLAHDPKHDLAALAIEADNLQPLRIGESAKLQPGELVLSIGHPWGVVGAATSGMVIGLEQTRNGEFLDEYIAVDLHLRPGYSGGPLLNVDGELVGVNTMMNGPDVGIAIPVHVVKKFLKDHLTV